MNYYSTLILNVIEITTLFRNLLLKTSEMSKAFGALGPRAMANFGQY